jgi:hypothetical protein
VGYCIQTKFNCKDQSYEAIWMGNVLYVPHSSHVGYDGTVRSTHDRTASSKALVHVQATPGPTAPFEATPVLL